MTLQVTCFAIGFETPDAGSEHDGSSERRKTTNCMNDNGACKILETQLVQPTTTPLPKATDRINYGGNKQAENDIGTKLHASYDRT